MARRRKKMSDRRALVVTLVFFLTMALAGTWVMSEGWRDAQELKWVRCEVVDAKSQRGSNHSSVAWFVVLYTSDCGPIVYQVGTRQNNVEGLVANFEPGPYEFKLGAVSQRRAEGVTLLDHSAVAKDIRALPTDEEHR